ncbi:hypothetical protein [Natrinema gelatinilyticum]|uniref:hypothetical protein n=1 Tax=Natrinema gelatinilyticum TaxID=2961571 RepID=UPI0030F46C10
MNTVGSLSPVFAFLIIVTAVTSGIGMANPASAADDDAVYRVAVQQNETTPHRNPNKYSEDGDLEGVERWLADYLSTQLSEGAIQLSEGEYELASDYVGEEYRERLGQYVDVAGQTDGESQEDEFKEAGEKQSQLSETVQEYWETKDEYEAAREAGNEERARELARELETLANETESLGGSVRTSYDEIEDQTNADLSEADTAIEDVTETIQTEQEVVREQLFKETELTLTPERETISFLEPLVAAGELRTADGTPIANERIKLAVGNHTEWVTTDAAGGFTFEYRPTNEQLSTDELTVQYVPKSQSVYLGDESNVSVSIEQAEPTVSLDEVSREVSYGDEAAVAGELAVDGIPVDGVTLAVFMEGEKIGTTTVTDGVFDGTVTVPASVPDGEAELDVRLPFDDQALAATTATTTVTVRETESELSIEGASTGDREITVNGTLGTVDGDGVAGETVQLRVDGTVVGNVTTEAGGTFGETVSVPDSVSEGDVTVTAVYEGNGSNLAPSTADTVVTVSEAGMQLPASVWLAGGFLVVSAASLGLWWYRRSAAELPSDGPAGDWQSTLDGTTAADEPPADDGQSPLDGTTAADNPSDPSLDTITPLLERAHEQLTHGQSDDATRTSYAAVRRALAARIDKQGALTHWEFYQTYCSNYETDAGLLFEITQGYERAAFGRNSVSTDEALRILERAWQLCGHDEQSSDGAPADD